MDGGRQEAKSVRGQPSAQGVGEAAGQGEEKEGTGVPEKTVSKVYVVMGNTGEYSDWTEWVVCVYFEEETAKFHVEKLYE